jgi:hypothetical protein
VASAPRYVQSSSIGVTAAAELPAATAITTPVTAQMRNLRTNTSQLESAEADEANYAYNARKPQMVGIFNPV